MLRANDNKELSIATSVGEFCRYAVKTHFVKEGEHYDDLIEKYVLPVYKYGDIVFSSEKILALCQGRVVKRDEIRISGFAKVLSKFAIHPSWGIGVGEPIKMQFAINQVGVFKVLIAAVASAFTKLFGIKGVFYKIVGQDVSGLDGFYGKIWEEYADIGILIPLNSSGVCEDVKNTYGVNLVVVDANDLGQEILGKTKSVSYSDDQLKEMIRDNPAGQDKQCTPFILARKSQN